MMFSTLKESFCQGVPKFFSSSRLTWVILCAQTTLNLAVMLLCEGVCYSSVFLAPPDTVAPSTFFLLLARAATPLALPHLFEAWLVLSTLWAGSQRQLSRSFALVAV